MTCILSPQVFDLEITIFNDYPIAFENGNTDEMYPDIDYPGKDIVIFFLPLWANSWPMIIFFFRFNLRCGDI